MLRSDNTAGIEDPGAQERPARQLAARTVRVIAAVLAVVLVAAVAFAVFWGGKVHDADQNRDNRAAAASVASQFALRMDKVDGSKFDDYIKSVNQLLTTKAKTKNSQVFNVMKQSYETAKVVGSGKVLMTAVGDSSDDSATVLVVHDASVKTTQGNLEHHYRWTVDMVKVDNKWLVDDFSPVN
jgi:Mce-associated membrane protein